MATPPIRHLRMFWGSLMFCLLLGSGVPSSAATLDLGSRSDLTAKAYLAVMGQASSMIIDEIAASGPGSGTVDWVVDLSHDFDAVDTEIGLNLDPSLSGRIQIQGTFGLVEDSSPASPVYKLESPVLRMLSDFSVVDRDSGAWASLEQGTEIRFGLVEVELNLASALSSGTLRLHTGSQEQSLLLEGITPAALAMKVNSDLAVNVDFQLLDSAAPGPVEYAASADGPLEVIFDDGSNRLAAYRYQLDLDPSDDAAVEASENLFSPEAGVWQQDMYAVINRNLYINSGVKFSGTEEEIKLTPISIKYFKADAENKLLDFHFVAPLPSLPQGCYELTSGKKDARTYWVMATPRENYAYKVLINNPTDKTIHLGYFGSACVDDSNVINMPAHSSYILRLLHNELADHITPFIIRSVDGLEHFQDLSSYEKSENGKFQYDLSVREIRDYTTLVLKNKSYMGLLYTVWKSHYDNETFVVPPFVTERRVNMAGQFTYRDVNDVRWIPLVMGDSAQGGALPGKGNDDIIIVPSKI